MKEKINKYWLELTNGTKTMFKEFFNKKTNKKQRANMWTFSRLITSLFIPIFSLISILTANISLFIVSIAITAFGGLTDFFDGRSARKHNSFSEYGRFLDQIADKLFSIMIGINVALFNPLYLLTLLGEGIIISVNIPYDFKYNDLKIKSTQMGRIKQWPLFSSLVFGFISVINPSLNIAANISIVVTFIFQLATALTYIKSNHDGVKKLKEDKKSNNLIEIKQEDDKASQLEKTIDQKTSDSIDKAPTKKDFYISLRDLLKDITNVKEENIKDYQKKLKNDQN